MFGEQQDIRPCTEMDFKMQCIAFLKTAASRTVAHSPLKYSLVRSFTCLAPQNIVHSRISSERRMGEWLQRQCEGDQVSSVVADHAKVHYTMYETSLFCGMMN